MAKDTSTTLPQHVTIVGAGTQGFGGNYSSGIRFRG